MSPSLPLDQEPCRAGISESPSAACVLDKVWNRQESQKVAAERLGALHILVDGSAVLSPCRPPETQSDLLSRWWGRAGDPGERKSRSDRPW